MCVCLCVGMCLCVCVCVFRCRGAWVGVCAGVSLRDGKGWGSFSVLRWVRGLSTCMSARSLSTWSWLTQQATTALAGSTKHGAAKSVELPSLPETGIVQPMQQAHLIHQQLGGKAHRHSELKGAGGPSGGSNVWNHATPRLSLCLQGRSV